ncbi:MAG: methyltransferase domain-containing protein, partial [Lachnospiraceae bacterium]|nr:methyltransferase domain-containing protein [Lachnospiraceae bacterium]
SSTLVGLVAAPNPGNLVLDVCSAPGGKSMHVADLMAGTGMVESRDLTEYKISLVEENIARCGFSNMRTCVWDATVLDPNMEGKADIVLADLPCSGLGIIGKKPDIKMRLQEEELHELAALQRKILSVVSRYVKPGGVLVYSTCTINPEENEGNALWIEENLPFKKKEIASVLPEALKNDCVDNRIQLLPGIHPCDGFFIAAFEREA